MSKLIEVIRRLLLVLFYLCTFFIAVIIYVEDTSRSAQDIITLIVPTIAILAVGHVIINWIFLKDD